MKTPKQSLNFWLNSRAGYYDPATINRLQSNQSAFNAYMLECERKYQSDIKKSMQKDWDRLKTLNDEMKEFLRLELWPMIMRSAGNDLNKAKEIVRSNPVKRIVEEYQLKDDINKQYLKCKKEAA